MLQTGDHSSSRPSVCAPLSLSRCSVDLLQSDQFRNCSGGVSLPPHSMSCSSSSASSTLAKLSSHGLITPSPSTSRIATRTTPSRNENPKEGHAVPGRKNRNHSRSVPSGRVPSRVYLVALPDQTYAAEENFDFRSGKSSSALVFGHAC